MLNNDLMATKRT